nr:MAG TPA: hypothetical protein [Caudoviricetes sp.]
MERIKLPQVFDKKRRTSSYVRVDREEFENLIECRRSVEISIATFEKVTIGVILIVTGIVIGIGIVGL